MFSADMQEANKRVVTIREAESKIVRELLRFMYTGKVENMDAIYFELFKLAHAYLVEDLQGMCEHFMIRHAKLENAVDMYTFGKKYELPLVTNRAKQILAA